MDFNIDFDKLTPEELMKTLTDQVMVNIYVGMMPEEERARGKAMFDVFTKHGVSPDVAVKILMDLGPIMNDA